MNCYIKKVFAIIWTRGIFISKSGRRFPEEVKLTTEQPTDEKTILLLRNLKDAGCGASLTEKFLLLERNGGRIGQRRLLLRQRNALLQKIHTNQQRIDCLDFLLHSIEGKKQGSTGRKAR